MGSPPNARAALFMALFVGSLAGRKDDSAVPIRNRARPKTVVNPRRNKIAKIHARCGWNRELNMVMAGTVTVGYGEHNALAGGYVRKEDQRLSPGRVPVCDPIRIIVGVRFTDEQVLGAIVGIQFPAARWRVLAWAEHNGACSPLRELLWELPERNFGSAEDMLVSLRSPRPGAQWEISVDRIVAVHSRRRRCLVHTRNGRDEPNHRPAASKATG
jgi:hypothetical protein